MSHKNDCEISMEEFNGDTAKDYASEVVQANLELVLEILEIGVTKGEDGNISYRLPTLERYAENIEHLDDILDLMGADFDE